MVPDDQFRVFFVVYAVKQLIAFAGFLIGLVFVVRWRKSSIVSPALLLVQSWCVGGIPPVETDPRVILHTSLMATLGALGLGWFWLVSRITARDGLHKNG